MTRSLTLKPIEAPRKHLGRFFYYHNDIIDNINENNNNKNENNIDCFIFIYSGHGDEDVITCSDGKKYSISTIQGFFDNSTLTSLSGKPKLFLYDCCRGADVQRSPTKKTKQK